MLHLLNKWKKWIPLYGTITKNQTVNLIIFSFFTMDSNGSLSGESLKEISGSDLLKFDTFYMYLILLKLKKCISFFGNIKKWDGESNYFCFCYNGHKWYFNLWKFERNLWVSFIAICSIFHASSFTYVKMMHYIVW